MFAWSDSLPGGIAIYTYLEINQFSRILECEISIRNVIISDIINVI